ncbi:MAG: DUF433 domain-containing protein [bacterium]|nr:DUF433 domain-containing protein [bacterium]
MHGVTTVDQLEAQIAQLSQAEKIELLQRIARDIARAVPGIEKTPGVVGGSARIAGTRIPVWVLVGYQQLGMGDSALLDSYPSLRQSDLDNAWAYFRLHRDEIEAEIREQEADADEAKGVDMHS